MTDGDGEAGDEGTRTGYGAADEPAPDEAPRGGSGEEESRTADVEKAPDSSHPRRRRRARGTPGLTCELCGGPVLDRHCKVVCLNCGYQRDCSDP